MEDEDIEFEADAQDGAYTLGYFSRKRDAAYTENPFTGPGEGALWDAWGDGWDARDTGECNQGRNRG